MVVIVRLDLDRYDLKTIGELVKRKIVTISEASQAKAFLALGEYEQVLCVRAWQSVLRNVT